MTTTPRTSEADMSFSTWLRKHHNGALDDQLTAALRELAQRVQLEGRNGTLTLKLTLSEEAGGVIVAHEVKRVDPKVNTAAFYNVWPNGTLSRTHPNQPQLPEMGDHETSDQ